MSSHFTCVWILCISVEFQRGLCLRLLRVVCGEALDLWVRLQRIFVFRVECSRGCSQGAYLPCVPFLQPALFVGCWKQES